MTDYETYSGYITGLYNIVTNYLKNRNTNEIDLIAVNEADKKVIVGECKRNPKRIILNILQEKAAKLQAKQKKFAYSFVGLSLKDM